MTGRRAWLFVAGTLFWALVIVGAVTGNGLVIGVAIALMLTALAIVGAGAAKGAAQREAERERIRETGRPARAKVVALEGAGGRINDSPKVAIELEVPAVAGDAYRVTVTAYISQLAIPRVQPGCEIDVWVDRGDPQAIAVDPALIR